MSPRRRALLALGVLAIAVGIVWLVRPRGERATDPGASGTPAPTGASGKRWMPIGDMEWGAPADLMASEVESHGSVAVLGVVTSSLTSEALPGATVVLLETKAQTRTDGRGRFHLDGLDRGNYRVRVSAAGYSTRVRWVTPAKPVTVRLDARVRIRGRVVDDDGAGIAGALVECRHARRPDDTDQTTSESDGAFDLGGCPDGELLVVAHHNRAGTGFAELEKRVSGEDVTGVIVRLTAAVQVQGVVTDGREPVVGAAVSLLQGERGVLSRTQTDASGSFDFGRVTAGSYRVFAASPDGRYAGLDVDAHRDRDVELVLEALWTLRGLVLDEGGAPAPDTQVEVTQRYGTDSDAMKLTMLRMDLLGSAATHATLLTDASGRFRVRRLPPGDYALRAKHPELGRAVAAVLSDGAQDREVTLELERGGRIVGRFVDPAGKTVPRAGSAFAALRGDGGHLDVEKVEFDAGEFEMTSIPPGEWSVFPHLEGETLGPKSAVVERGATAEVSWTLQPKIETYSVRGRVVSAGAPVPSVQVNVRRYKEGGGFQYGIDAAKTDLDGQFVIDRVVGRTGLEFRHPDYENVDTELEVTGAADVGTISLMPGEPEAVREPGAR